MVNTFSSICSASCLLIYYEADTFRILPGRQAQQLPWNAAALDRSLERAQLGPVLPLLHLVANIIASWCKPSDTATHPSSIMERAELEANLQEYRAQLQQVRPHLHHQSSMMLPLCSNFSFVYRLRRSWCRMLRTRSMQRSTTTSQRCGCLIPSLYHLSVVRALWHCNHRDQQLMSPTHAAQAIKLTEELLRSEEEAGPSTSGIAPAEGTQPPTRSGPNVVLTEAPVIQLSSVLPATVHAHLSSLSYLVVSVLLATCPCKRAVRLLDPCMANKATRKRGPVVRQLWGTPCPAPVPSRCCPPTL